MRILLITDGIWPFVMGGMQKHSYYLAKFLAQKGERVHVVHCASGLACGAELQRGEFKDFVHGKITFLNIPFPVLPRIPGHYLRAGKRYSNAVYAAMKPHLGEFDLVYCQGFTAWAFIKGIKKGEVRIPVLSNLHGYEMFQRPPSLQSRLSRLPLRTIAKQVSTGSTAVFSFGGHITGILQRMGITQDRILECPIGIEERWLVDAPASHGAAERVFVFVGRDERRKGVVELTRVLKGMLASGQSAFRFHFLGPIAKEHRLEADNITYHGAVADEVTVQHVLRSADVLVCPSYSEGMPTVIMEAMASGLAIIATDVGAVGKQVDENGWLLAGPRHELIRSAMEQALAVDEGRLMRMKQRSLAKVRGSFMWEEVIAGKLELMARVVRRCSEGDRQP